MFIDNVYYVLKKKIYFIFKCIVMAYGHHDIKLSTALHGRRFRSILDNMSHPRFFRASVEAHYHGHKCPDIAHRRCSGDQAC